MRSQSKLTHCTVVFMIMLILFSQVIPVNANGLLAGDRGVTIQSLIDAAPDGGTINLAGGTFSETLVINKNLTINGYGFYETILQPGADNQRVIRVTTGHNLNLTNIQIKNGEAPGGSGGGVLMEGGSLYCNQCIFSNNSADYGGAIFQEGSGYTLEIRNSYMDNNYASWDGGAVYAKGNAILYNSLIGYNTAVRNGGGIHAQENLTLTFGKFEANHATTGNGGGINVNNNVTIVGTYFENNTADDQGGGINQWNSGKTVSLEAVTFESNSTKFKGGGAYFKSHATISYTSFISNTVNAGAGTQAYGGGLDAEAGADITYGRFINNQALCNTCSLALGGGIYTGGGVLNVTNALFARNAAKFGSAIDFTSTTGWLNHVTISQPSVGNHSAIRINSGSNLTMFNSIVNKYETGALIQGTLIEGYNLWFGNTVNTQVDGGTLTAIGHDVTGQDPKFVNPAGDDYHLKAFSPAIGAGTSSDPVVIYDLDVKSRIARWDLGAYQFWTSYYLPILFR